MGYTTEFYGEILVEPKFTDDIIQEINTFSKQDHRNEHSLPGYHCNWIIEEDKIRWNGGEKFYDSEEWMGYLINRWVIPTGRVANGVIECEGEDTTDLWRLVVTDNVVSRVNAVISWPTEVTVEWPEKTEYWQIEEITLVSAPYIGRHRA